MDTPHAYILLNTALYSVLYTVLYTALYTEHSIASCQSALLTFLVSWHKLLPPSCFLYTIPNTTLCTLLNHIQYSVQYILYYTVDCTVYCLLKCNVNPYIHCIVSPCCKKREKKVEGIFFQEMYAPCLLFNLLILNSTMYHVDCTLQYGINCTVHNPVHCIQTF